MARAALRRGWAAVAFSSADREQRCWDTHSPGRDVDSSRDMAAVRWQMSSRVINACSCEDALCSSAAAPGCLQDRCTVAHHIR